MAPAASAWTPQEDLALMRAVGNGVNGKSWNVIAALVDGRNARQCRERWVTHLSPYIDTREFAMEEDAFLIRKAGEGMGWSKIAAQLPGRTDQQVKNRWNVLNGTRKRKRPMPCSPPSAPCFEITESTTESFQPLLDVGTLSAIEINIPEIEALASSSNNFDFFSAVEKMGPQPHVLPPGEFSLVCDEIPSGFLANPSAILWSKPPKHNKNSNSKFKCIVRKPTRKQGRPAFSTVFGRFGCVGADFQKLAVVFA